MNLLRLTFLLLCCCSVSAQVGIGTDTPDPAAVLDINSEISTGVYGGLKLPTINEADKSSIATPIPDGLMLYVIDGPSRCVELYDATSAIWVDFYCMNQVPVAQVVTAIDDGTPQVGEVVSTNYDENNIIFQTDNENDTPASPTIQWYRADDTGGTNQIAITGANAATYTLTTADAGSHVAVGIVPNAATGASPGAEVVSSYSASPVAALPTEVDFVTATSIIQEDGLSIDVSLQIANPSPTVATSIEIALNGSSTATNGLDFDNGALTPASISFPVTITFPAGSAANQDFTIYISTDDVLIESSETIILDLQNVSGGNSAVIGSTNSHTVTISDNDAPITPWINEMHYDNAGGDANEGVEIAAVAGTDLTGYTLRFWNGNTTAAYGTEVLTGIVPNLSNGYGVLWFPYIGIQNGAPDGIALYDATDTLIQFLSYEGSFTNAFGEISTDIGVSETTGTTVGFSLQLTGLLGSQYSDFTWQAPAAHSRGTINSGQTF